MENSFSSVSSKSVFDQDIDLVSLLETEKNLIFLFNNLFDKFSLLKLESLSNLLLDERKVNSLIMEM
jgi:hypothetical protein